TLLAGGTLTVNVALSEFVTISGALIGQGGLTKIGLGELTLSGNLANSYGGTTRANAGDLVLQKSRGATAIPGPPIIDAGSGGPQSDKVILLAADQIADTAPVTLNSSGLLKMNNHSDKVKIIANTGKVTTGDPPTLTVDFDDITVTFEGEISGPGYVVKD